jgi:hypothetical protein
MSCGGDSQARNETPAAAVEGLRDNSANSKPCGGDSRARSETPAAAVEGLRGGAQTPSLAKAPMTGSRVCQSLCHTEDTKLKQLAGRRRVADMKPAGGGFRWKYKFIY